MVKRCCVFYSPFVYQSPCFLQCNSYYLNVACNLFVYLVPLLKVILVIPTFILISALISLPADVPRAEWAIDNVVIAVNDSSSRGFQDNFSPMQRDSWYTTQNAVPRITCHSRDNALEFSKNDGRNEKRKKNIRKIDIKLV